MTDPIESEAAEAAEELPIPTPENPWRSPRWVAEATGVKPYTVADWCRSKRIKAYKIMGEWKILHSDFVAFCQREWGSNE